MNHVKRRCKNGKINLKKIESLHEKVREVQQRSEHLEKEWEKGEQVWCEYLKELEKNRRRLGRSCQNSTISESIPHTGIQSVL